MTFQACPLKSKSYYSAEEAEADHLSDDDGKTSAGEGGGGRPFWTRGPGDGSYGPSGGAAGAGGPHAGAGSGGGGADRASTTFPPLTRAELEVSTTAHGQV